MELMTWFDSLNLTTCQYPQQIDNDLYFLGSKTRFIDLAYYLMLAKIL